MNHSDFDFEPHHTQNHIVYTLSNAALPGIVKIGKSSIGAFKNRLSSLSNTSVPIEFRIENVFLCSHGFSVEKSIHRLLDGCRVSPNREFFRISPDAISLILSASGMIPVQKQTTALNMLECNDADEKILPIEHSVKTDQIHLYSQPNDFPCINLIQPYKSCLPVLGTVIKRKRRHMKISQKKFSELSGISRANLERLENGRAEMISFEAVSKSLHILGIQLRPESVDSTSRSLDELFLL